MTTKKSQPKKSNENVFEDEESLPVPVSPESELTRGLDEEQKAEFSRLLKEKMSLNDRADILIKLAKMTDTKRAPVGLRAIQEINKITGVTNDATGEVSPMFVLPPNTAVAIMVKKPEE